jgi:hypothetical protein
MRRRATLGLLAGVFACWAGLAPSQTLVPKYGKETVVFIHSGPRPPNDPVVRAVAVALLQQGFLVREPEPDQDRVGGPGVDYFDPTSMDTARQIASSVNQVLSKEAPSAKPLAPRLQKASTPAFYFGVWLF